MKKLLFAAIAFALVCSCNNKDQKPASVMSDNKSSDIVIEDTAIYGDYSDAASQTLELRLASDTTKPVTFYIPDDSITPKDDIVFGGIVGGSKFAVIADKDPLGDYDYVAKKIINLTTLMGKWVETINHDTLKLDDEKSWIKNGQIIATGEPLDITYLDVDTLELESKDYIRRYYRSKK